MEKNDPLDAENLKRVKRAGRWIATAGLTMIAFAAWLIWGLPGLLIILGVPAAAVGVGAMHVVAQAENEKAASDYIKKKMGIN